MKEEVPSVSRVYKKTLSRRTQLLMKTSISYNAILVYSLQLPVKVSKPDECTAQSFMPISSGQKSVGAFDRQWGWRILCEPRFFEDVRVM